MVSGNGSMNSVNEAVQGTEYTLQGVMRYLQTEWHRHERERNIWEIERAEMKSRISRLEGGALTNKRKSETLEKHICMLENALKRERENNKKLRAGEKVEPDSDVNATDAAKENLKAIPKYINPNNLSKNEEGVNDDLSIASVRELSRVYLNKCANEITYNVLPGSHPPPDLGDLQISNHSGHFDRSQPYDPFPNRQPQPTHQLAHQQQPQPQQQPNKRPYTSYSHPYESSKSPSVSTSVRELPQRPSNESSPRDGVSFNRDFLTNDRRASKHQQQRHLVQNQQYDRKGDMTTADTDEGLSVEDSPTLSQRQDEDDGAYEWRKSDGNPSPQPDDDMFPNADFVSSSPPKQSSKPARQAFQDEEDQEDQYDLDVSQKEPSNFEVRYALTGHLDVVRCAIFTGGGSPSEPEVCTCGDDGTIKRWVIPTSYNPSQNASDLDVTSYFTHRGHNGCVTCLAACPPSANFSSGGRALGDGWIFSGGQDGTVKVWERGRVDAKATLEGHTDAVWSVCVLPGTTGSVFTERAQDYGSDRILLVSGAADGKVMLWAVSAPPQINAPQQQGGRTRAHGRRSNSISSGSNFPVTPQPSTATTTPFHYTLIHQITRKGKEGSPTCITPMSSTGENFLVSYNDGSVIIYDTRTGEEIRTFDSGGVPEDVSLRAVNSLIAISPQEQNKNTESESISNDNGDGSKDDRTLAADVVCAYEDQHIRFFSGSDGRCTHEMLAHPEAISSLSLSPDGTQFVSGGHDSSLRFWSLERRDCVQEITSHRPMRGEGVCSVVWSQDGRWVVSGGGDGVVKVFSR